MRYLAVSFAAAKAAPSQSPAWFQGQEATASHWGAAFLVVYPIEFMLLSVTKLLILDRMIFFAAATAAEWSPAPMERRITRLAVAARVTMIAVVAGNCLGVLGNVVAAVYWIQGANQHSQAAAAFAGNYTSQAIDLASAARQTHELGEKFSSIQKFSEVVVLLLIIVAFAVASALCSRRINSTVRRSADLAAAQHLRAQILGTTAVVFVTFLLRTIFSTMFAVADALQNDGEPNCSGLCEGCKNVYTHIQVWVHYTPEFRMVVILISSPLALLVALWGMTSKRTLQLMQLRFGCMLGQKTANALLPLNGKQQQVLNPSA